MAIGGFTINIAKHNTKSVKPRKLSRLCLAKVIEDENENLIVRVPRIGDDFDSDNCLVIPFTEQSLKLENRERIFRRHKDKHKHWVCVVQNYEERLRSKNECAYRAFAPGVILAGHIVNVNGKLYFDYTKFIGYSVKYPVILNTRIDSSKPLFEKENE